MSATEQLDDRIRELVLRGDMEAIVRLVASSRAIATACELENAALWALQRTVTAFADAFDSDIDIRPTDPILKALWRDVLASLEPFAADYGLPLPGAGEGW